MKELVLFLARQLVDHPESVVVSDNEARGGLSLKVHASDLKRVIGREGRVVKAIRTLLGASAEAGSSEVGLDVRELDLG